ncbi:MAG: hypothetical protein IH881_12800 [Myxococcales bacterium]|nr:hypothetical protein [Myxococcales bacterium]
MSPLGVTLVLVQVEVPPSATPGALTTFKFRSVQIVDENLALVPEEDILQQGELSFFVP